MGATSGKLGENERMVNPKIIEFEEKLNNMCLDLMDNVGATEIEAYFEDWKIMDAFRVAYRK